MIKFHRSYIEIRSDRFLYYWSTLTGLEGRSRAGTFWPFIFITQNIELSDREAILNHERIHISQQAEMLVVGSWILWIVELIWWRIIRRKTAKQAYLLRSVEQEAYANMYNPNYLGQRKPFAHFRYYLKSKPVRSTLTEKVL